MTGTIDLREKKKTSGFFFPEIGTCQHWAPLTVPCRAWCDGDGCNLRYGKNGETEDDGLAKFEFMIFQSTADFCC